MKKDGKDGGWLDDPRNVRLIIVALCVACGFLLLADLVPCDRHAHFDFEGWFGFYAVFGFVIFCVIVISGKYLRKLIRRDEDYYD